MEEMIEEAQPLPEEPVPNIVFVRAKKKKERKSLQPTIQVLVSFVTAIVAVTGIILSYMSARTQWDTARSNRFTYAIEHLKDESLAIRMGALFELKKLGLEDNELQESIVRILGPFIRNGIEDEGLLFPPTLANYFPYVIEGEDFLEKFGIMQQPQDDVLIAFEVASLFRDNAKLDLSFLQAGNLVFIRSVQLQNADLFGAIFENTWFQGANLEGATLAFAVLRNADLVGANFKNADLVEANLINAWLNNANLQGADLTKADLTGAALWGVNFHGAKNLTAKQLLLAKIDDTTKLDPELRAEYEALKAKQDAKEHPQSSRDSSAIG